MLIHLLREDHVVPFLLTLVLDGFFWSVYVIMLCSHRMSPMRTHSGCVAWCEQHHLFTISKSRAQALYVNKKVLLRECKRHTDRHLSSTPSAVLSLRVPHPRSRSRWRGVYPIPGPDGGWGYPTPGPDRGAPSLEGDTRGSPRCPDLAGVPPPSDGVLPSKAGWGYPLPPGWGIPPPPPVWTWPGYLPCPPSDLAGVTPPPPQSGPGRGTLPPHPRVWTN